MQHVPEQRAWHAPAADHAMQISVVPFKVAAKTKLSRCKEGVARGRIGGDGSHLAAVEAASNRSLAEQPVCNLRHPSVPFKHLLLPPCACGELKVTEPKR